MIKNKRERRNMQEIRLRSQSQDLHSNSDFEQQMKCDQTLQDINYFMPNFQKVQQIDDKCTCICAKCQGFIKKIENKDIDAQQKKRQKRRQYKKRQKLKTQQKKQQALKYLSSIIMDIYGLKTDSQIERLKIDECLTAIQKNQNRFYEFINAVIRQQVEAIKKQMRICLSQLASESPNFSMVPRLYEQFMKVKEASPEVEIIINLFIRIISEKNQQPPRYHRDLDKKTFKFLLISDVQNRNNFLRVIKIIEDGNIKYEREKQMLRMMVQMIKQKNISSQCSSSDDSQRESDDNSQRDYSDIEDQQCERRSEYKKGQNTTKSSEREDLQNQFDQQNGDSDQNQKQNRQGRKGSLKRKRKNKNLKIYEPSYQKTYQMLIFLQKTLRVKKDQRLPCNLQQQWAINFREKFLKAFCLSSRQSKRPEACLSIISSLPCK